MTTLAATGTLLIEPSDAAAPDLGEMMEGAVDGILGFAIGAMKRIFGYDALAEIAAPFVGDWKAIARSTDAWTHAGNANRVVGSNYAQLIDSSTPWQGAAADAFRQRVTSMAECQERYASGCEALGILNARLLDLSIRGAEAIKLVMGIIGDLLNELLEKCASGLFGALEAAVTAWGKATKFYDRAQEIWRIFNEVVEAIIEIVTAFHTIVEVIKMIVDTVKMIGETLSGLTNGETAAQTAAGLGAGAALGYTAYSVSAKNQATEEGFRERARARGGETFEQKKTALEEKMPSPNQMLDAAASAIETGEDIYVANEAADAAMDDFGANT